MEHLDPRQVYQMISKGQRQIINKVLHFKFTNESIVEFIKHIYYLLENDGDKVIIENCNIRIYNLYHFMLLLETELFLFKNISIVPRMIGIDDIFIKKEYL